MRYTKGWNIVDGQWDAYLAYFKKDTKTHTDSLNSLYMWKGRWELSIFECEDEFSDYDDVIIDTCFKDIHNPTEAELALFEVEFGIPFPVDLFPKYVELLEG